MARVLCALLPVVFLSSCYLSKQGYRQVSLLAAREPVDEVLRQGKVSGQERKRLEFAKTALAYAEASGLDVGSAYQEFVAIEGDAVSYTVQAAKPLDIKLRTWWFPIVGSVPYLGFFDEKDRDEEAKDLEASGYEIHRGSVAAYSSLGWFADPVYSSMLRRSDVELAHLYFHELTHRTLWLKDGAEFNENLAEYVADELTQEFFKSLNREEEWSMFKEVAADHDLFREWLQSLRGNLEGNLRATAGRPDGERVTEKNKVIQLAVSRKPAFKRVDFVGSRPWNTARVLSAGLYSPDTKAFSKAASCFSRGEGTFHAGKFLKALENLAEKTANGFDALTRMCAQ